MSRMQDVLRVLVEPANRLEQALQALYVDRSLANAEGVQLDALGKLVGQPRGGLLDDVYREYIRARVLTSTSNGTVEEIIAVADLLTGGAADLEVDQQPPAAFVLRVTGMVVSEELAETLVTFLRDLASAGVRALLYTHLADDATAFAFFDAPDGLGFSSTGAPSSGGTFSTVQE